MRYIVDLPPFQKKKEGRPNVQFKLQEAGAATIAEKGRVVGARRRTREANAGEPQSAVVRGSGCHGAGAESAHRSRRKAGQARPLAQADRVEFEMAIGETVVVGTSKIGGGDKGLVVLLTSVAGK